VAIRICDRENDSHRAAIVECIKRGSPPFPVGEQTDSDHARAIEAGVSATQSRGAAAGAGAVRFNFRRYAHKQ